MPRSLRRGFLFFPILSVIPVFSLLFFWGISQSQQGAIQNAATAIEEITVVTFPHAAQVDIKGNGGSLNYVFFQLSHPPRLVLDFPAVANASGKSYIQIADAILKVIRIGQHPQKTRIVFEFSGGRIPFNQIEKRPNALTVLFGEKKRLDPVPQKQKETSVSSDEMKMRKRPAKSTAEGDQNRTDAVGNAIAGNKEKAISLDFENTDIRLIIKKIADESHQNIVVSDEVQGKITLRLKDIPWDQALGVIIKITHLAILKEGDVLRIITQKEFKQKEQ